LPTLPNSLIELTCWIESFDRTLDYQYMVKILPILPCSLIKLNCDYLEVIETIKYKYFDTLIY